MEFGRTLRHLSSGGARLSHISTRVSGTKLATWCRLSSGNAPPNNAGNCRKKTFQWRPWPSLGFSESCPGITMPTLYCGAKGGAFARVPTCCDLPRGPPEHGSPLRSYNLESTDPPPFGARVPDTRGAPFPPRAGAWERAPCAKEHQADSPAGGREDHSPAEGSRSKRACCLFGPDQWRAAFPGLRPCRKIRLPPGGSGSVPLRCSIPFLYPLSPPLPPKRQNLRGGGAGDDRTDALGCHAQRIVEEMGITRTRRRLWT